MSGLERAASRLRGRIVGALALALLTFLALELLVSHLAGLDRQQLVQQAWAWVAYEVVFFVLLGGYTWLGLRPVVAWFDRSSDHRVDNEQAREQARVAVARFPVVAVLLGVGLALLMFGSKVLLDRIGFGLPWSRTLALAVQGTALMLLVASALHLLLRAWGRPIFRQLGREVLPAGARVGLAVRTVAALLVAMTAAALPAAVGTCRVDQQRREGIAHHARDLGARLAAAGRAGLGADALREVVAELRLEPSSRVVFSDEQGANAAALPAGQRARYLRIDPRVSDGLALPPQMLGLLAALFGLLLVLAFNLGESLAGDVRRLTARVNALATAAEVGADERGRAPTGEVVALTPLAASAPRVAELRQLANALNDVLTRLAEMHVAHFVAVEKTLEVDRLRTRFLASMSHDLRSPLSGLLGYCELLLRGASGALSPRQREAVETTFRNGKRLQHLIDEVLDSAKVEAGRMVLHTEDTAPAELLTAAMRCVNERGLPDGLVVETELQPGMPVLRTDRQRLAEAVAHLVRFWARRSSGGGEVRVQLRVSPPRADDPRHRLRIVVSDRSAPLDAAAREQAFVGFRRAPGQVGLGLEAALARAFIELHDGTLVLESTEHGNRFVAEIPAMARVSARLRPVKV